LTAPGILSTARTLVEAIRISRRDWQQTAMGMFISPVLHAPTGTALIYATYLGGAAGESGRAIGVDDAKNAYITGSTFSTDFPTVSPLQGALRGTADNVNPDVPATFIVSVTTTSRSLGMLRFPGLSRSTWLWAMATISLFVRPSVRREQAIDEP